MSQPPGFQLLIQELAGRARHDPRDDVVRLAARLRARDGCEYCLLPTAIQFEIDHIIPPALWDAYTGGRLRAVRPALGRGGPDHLDNFTWSCSNCNRIKGEQVVDRIGRQA